MKLGLYYRVIVTNKNGRIVKRSRWRSSRSFVKAFLQHLDGAINHESGVAGTTFDVIDVTNTARTIPYFAGALNRFMAVFAPDNNADYGIQVGTGTTTPTNSDYALASKIAHGTGAGQLDYGPHGRTAPAVVGANVDYVISRTFYNGSGATITVNEIGIVCATRNYIDAGPYFFLLVRDVITATSVLNTQTLTVQYTLRTTV